MRRLAILAAFLALAAPARAGEATVLAAASLKESLDAVAADFEAEGRHKLLIVYGGSNALARQIEHGAPADVFISADAEWTDYLDRHHLVVPGSRRDLLANDLVLVAPASSPVSVKLHPGVSLAGALGGKRIALADPDAVPAGKYAKAAFIALGAWKELEDRIAATENVRAALALVARGEAPLGVVYRTDAMAEKKVRVVDVFPANTHPLIVYPVVRVKRQPSPAADAFGEYLASRKAMATFARFGFRSP